MIYAKILSITTETMYPAAKLGNQFMLFSFLFLVLPMLYKHSYNSQLSQLSSTQFNFHNFCTTRTTEEVMNCVL